MCIRGSSVCQISVYTVWAMAYKISSIFKFKIMVKLTSTVCINENMTVHVYNNWPRHTGTGLLNIADDGDGGWTRSLRRVAICTTVVGVTTDLFGDREVRGVIVKAAAAAGAGEGRVAEDGTHYKASDAAIHHADSEGRETQLSPAELGRPSPIRSRSPSATARWLPAALLPRAGPCTRWRKITIRWTRRKPTVHSPLGQKLPRTPHRY